MAAEGSQVESFSAEEFAFLRESLLDSSADSGSSLGKSESGKFSSEAILISNVIRNSSDGFGAQTQKFLRQFRDKLNGNLVVEVLNLVRNPELGVGFSYGQVVKLAIVTLVMCTTRCWNYCKVIIIVEYRNIFCEILRVMTKRCLGSCLMF